MGSSWKPLFAGDPLEEELDAHRKRTQFSVHTLAPRDLEPDRQSTVIERHAYRSVQLFADRAELDSEPVEGRVGVTVRIPFEGNADLFCHAPAGTEWTPRTQVRDGSGFYTGDPEEQPSVAFAQLFDADVDESEVRSWAESVTVRLGRVLVVSSLLIKDFNDELANEIPRLASQQLKAIHAASAIAGPLRPTA